MRTTTFEYERFCDDLGPSKIVQIYEPRCGLRAVVVVDNTACGPSIGGVRMAPDVSTEEVFRLARAMTLKNAAAGLPHGGGKAGILADPKGADKERLIRTFARAIRDLREYVPGPDMGTDEMCMAWIVDEIGRAVGLPRDLGGIPLDEIGATGYGVAECADVAAPFCSLDLSSSSMAIEGFGNVGRHAARFLAQRGVTLVAASDSHGAVYNPDGIRIGELSRFKRETGSVKGFPHARAMARQDLLTVRCDILVPAARPDSIHGGNVRDIKAKLILEGANIPALPEIEAELHAAGVVVVPDFIANAGGVTCAAVEYAGGSEAEAFTTISERVRRNTEEVLSRSRRERVPPRTAAMAIARERVLEAMTDQQELREMVGR